MTITLTTATRVGGAVVAPATTATYDPAIEADLVSRGMATYVSRQGVTDTGVPVMAVSNPITGVITSISTLTQSQYDALSPRDPSTLYIIVDGAAVDLDPPVFTSGAVAAAIDELSGAGQVIYTATSTDASLPVSYSLKAVGDHTAFSIGATSGAVTLIGNPDYETKSAYSFTIIATDAAGNASEQAVTLAINDVDEGAIPDGPALQTAAVNGATLVLTYDSADLQTPAPSVSAYSVSGASPTAQTPASVVVSGATVTLTLSTPAAFEQTVTVSYAVPGTNPLRNAAGGNADALTAQAVTNNTASVFAAIYGAGTQGVYVPSVARAAASGALWQDTGATTAATTAGQTVARINDASGRNNHFTQDGATARPAIAIDGSGRLMLSFDGSNDAMSSPELTLAAEGFYAGIIEIDATLAAAAYAGPFKVARSGGSPANINDELINIYTPGADPTKAQVYRRYPTVASLADTAGKLPGKGVPYVFWANVRASGGTYGAISAGANGSTALTYADCSGAGTVELMRSASVYTSKGRLYGAVVCCAALDDTQLATAKRELAAVIGVTL